MSFILRPGHQLRPWPLSTFSIPNKRPYYQPTYQAYRASNALLWSCIGVNCAVFGAWQYATEIRAANIEKQLAILKTGVNLTRKRVFRFLNENFLLSRRDISEGKYWTLLTSACSHKELFHLVFNMISLYTFGSILINAVASPWQLSAVLVGSALAGSLGFVYHQQSLPLGQRSYGLGASGMVMGAGMVAAMLRPRSPIVLVFVPMPLWVALGLYVAYDSFYLDNPLSRTGHAAHLGGAAFGAIYYTVFLRRLGGVLAPRF